MIQEQISRNIFIYFDCINLGIKLNIIYETMCFFM